MTKLHYNFLPSLNMLVQVDFHYQGASRAGFSYEAIEDLKIAVSEAITNSVKHAFKGEDDGEITVEYLIYEDKLEVRVSDNGTSFDLETRKQEIGPYEVGEDAEMMRIGGLGLF